MTNKDTTPTGPQAQEAGISELLALIPTNWCDSLLTGPNAVINGPTYDGQDIERLLLAIRKRIEAFVPPARVVSDSELPELPECLPDAIAYPRVYTATQMQQYARAALSTLQSGAEGKDGEIESLTVRAEKAELAVQGWFKRAGDFLIRSQRYEAVLKDCRAELSESMETEGRHSGMAELVRRIDTALQPGQGT